MSKIKNNATNTNTSMINVLNQNIKDKISFHDELAKVHDLYGVFLSNNTFVVAIQHREYLSETIYSLNNYFTGNCMECATDWHKGIFFAPWRPGKLFSVDGLNAVAFPIKKFLNKHIVNGVTLKRNINALFEVANEYLKEHPDFVDSLFVEIIRKR